MKKRLQNLIDVMQDSGEQYNPALGFDDYVSNSELAKFLLDCGVIVPPVKVGDTMWVLSKDLSTIQSVVITDIYCRWHNMGASISLVTNNPFAYLFCDYEIGIKIFFTEEEAKRALEETNKK